MDVYQWTRVDTDLYATGLNLPSHSLMALGKQGPVDHSFSLHIHLHPRVLGDTNYVIGGGGAT
jgi:diadenosine tetraphosphate (Ap4A) HIT family hydrolase